MTLELAKEGNDNFIQNSLKNGDFFYQKQRKKQKNGLFF